MIRLYDDNDKVDILKLAKEFAGQTESEGYVDENLIFMLNKCIAEGFVLVAEEEEKIVGMVGGIFIFSPLMNGIVFSETAWYVDEKNRGCGKDLFDEMERMVGKTEAKAIVVCAYCNNYQKVVERMYRMREYKEVEHFWMKKIGDK